MPSTSSRITTISRISLPQLPSSFAPFRTPLFAISVSVLDCFDDDEGLCPRVIVGERQVDMCGVASGDHLLDPFGGAAGQRERRSARWRIDDADVFHEHAAVEA